MLMNLRKKQRLLKLAREFGLSLPSQLSLRTLSTCTAMRAVTRATYQEARRHRRMLGMNNSAVGAGSDHSDPVEGVQSRAAKTATSKCSQPLQLALRGLHQIVGLAAAVQWCSRQSSPPQQGRKQLWMCLHQKRGRLRSQCKCHEGQCTKGEERENPSTEH